MPSARCIYILHTRFIYIKGFYLYVLGGNQLTSTSTLHFSTDTRDVPLVALVPNSSPSIYSFSFILFHSLHSSFILAGDPGSVPRGSDVRDEAASVGGLRRRGGEPV